MVWGIYKNGVVMVSCVMVMSHELMHKLTVTVCFCQHSRAILSVRQCGEGEYDQRVMG